MAELLRVEGLTRRLRRGGRRPGRRLRARGRPFARAAGPQRHRQDDAAQHAGRRDAPPRRPIALAGRDVTALPPHERAAAGIGWVPQERNIFKSLTVRREPDAPSRGRGRGRPSASTRCFRASPSARPTWATSSRAASSRCSRSARALVLNPKLLLLDEPLEGLAPIIVQELLRSIERLVTRRRALARSSSSRTRARSCRSRTMRSSSTAARSSMRRRAPSCSPTASASTAGSRCARLNPPAASAAVARPEANALRPAQQRGASSAPSAAGTAMPSTYQTATNGSAISLQCRA